MIFKIGENFAV